MTNWRRRWVWPAMISAVGLGVMVLISVLRVPPLPSVMAVDVKDLPEVSFHRIPFYLNVTATTADPPTGIWLVRQESGWRALSDRGDHPTACGVQWMADQGVFIDPCPGSVYDRTGRHIAGPARTGLDAYPIKEIGPRRFEVDLSEPRPVTGR